MQLFTTASTVWALVFVFALCRQSSTSSDSDGAATPNPVAEGLGLLLGLPVDADVASESVPPQFMMDMYNCWTEAGAENCPPEGDTVYQMTDVDVLRSFVGQRRFDSSRTTVQSYNNQAELTTSMDFYFNTTCSIRRNETMHSAEVRIYKNALSQDKLLSLGEKCDLSSGLRVHLYLVNTNEKYNVATLEQNIDLTEADLLQDKWVIFHNLTKLYLRWLEDSTQGMHNHSISLSIALADSCSSIHPSEFGFTSEEGKEALILSFSKSAIDTRQRMSISDSRKRRSTDDGTIEQPLHVSTLNWTLDEYQKHPCRLYYQEVTFAELGWSEYVLSPDSYSANFCAGTCDYPLNYYDNSTMHSYIQSIVNHNNADVIPPPCCVPTELRPVAVLYKEGPETFALHTWTDMKATACGCH